MTQKLYWRHAVLIFFSLGLLTYLYLGPVIVQNPAYHLFADARPFLGIPNFGDVMSNLPFLIFGFMGAQWLLTTEKKVVCKTSWLTFFVGVMLVAPGSAYYHWAPDNVRLVWDRLPMTIGFMGLFVALLAEYIDLRIEKMLPLFLLLGFSSVVLWHMTSDLRLYYWVQATSMLCIPLILLLYPSLTGGRKWLMLAFLAYGIAKVVEATDPQIFNGTGNYLSGHTLKHLFASLAPLFVLKMLKVKTVPAKN